MPADRKVALHRQALTSLAEPPDGAPDPARLAHHAEALGDAHVPADYGCLVSTVQDASRDFGACCI